MTAKVLHVSDSLIGTAKNNDPHETGIEGIAAAVQRAQERDVDALVHTGNLFRRPNPDDEIVNAVRDKLQGLAAVEIPFFLLEGRRESRSEGDSLARLVELETVHKLTTEPEIVDDIALYGIDHVPDEDSFVDRLTDLKPSEDYTYNIICVNQRIWPPVQKNDALISAFDLMDGTNVHVNEVLAGGLDESRIWESDDFDYQVTYSGSTHPKNQNGGSIRGTLVDADTDKSSRDQIPLVTTSVEDELETLRHVLDYQQAEIENADVETLADLYGLAARAKSLFEERRKEIRGEILERVEEDQNIKGRYAKVNRNTQRRRNVKSEEKVTETIEQADIDREAVTSLDTSALRDLVDENELSENEVFDIEKRPYVRLSEIML